MPIMPLSVHAGLVFTSSIPEYWVGFKVVKEIMVSHIIVIAITKSASSDKSIAQKEQTKFQ